MESSVQTLSDDQTTKADLDLIWSGDAIAREIGREVAFAAA